jgi:hypothetical protein
MAPLNVPYLASGIKRRRATSEEMEARAAFLIDYARRHGPVTVRQLYYQAEVHGLPGIEKTDAGYDKVQRQVLDLRRAGRMGYGWIADATRWMRKPQTFRSPAEAALDVARHYRKSLWTDASEYLEIWCEKDALAGVIYPVTDTYDVPLMVSRGFASETFAYEAVQARDGDPRPYVVYYLGDFDRAGQDAMASLEEKLNRFAAGIEVIFRNIAVTPEQVAAMGLPTRTPKRGTASDLNWPFGFACELDAIPPATMREIVERAINDHLPQDQLRVLKVAEESERELIETWAAAHG